jgi:hypothetical protein
MVAKKKTAAKKTVLTEKDPNVVGYLFHNPTENEDDNVLTDTDGDSVIPFYSIGEITGYLKSEIFDLEYTPDIDGVFEVYAVVRVGAMQRPALPQFGFVPYKK